MESTEININIQINVDGKYKQATEGDYYTQGTPQEFRIYKVFWGKIDITNQLSAEDFIQIEENILQEMNNNVL